ncbi:MAG: GNAT family N-acetyltransferase [Bacteroidota bacterium]
MEIRIIRIKELPDFLNSEEYRNMPEIPISRHRGLSHAYNPRAKPEEAALVLVYIDTQLMGYLGFVPDTIYLEEAGINLGWMSCIWVSPDARGKGIAKAMLKRGFEEWENRVIVTEFTEIAKNIYERYGDFMDLTISNGIRAYMRANLAYLLPAKRPSLHKLKPLLRLIDGVLNLFHDFRLRIYQINYRKHQPTYEYLSEIDGPTEAFIRSFQKEELFRRGASELNWMLHHPWVLSAPAKDEPAQRYYFTSVANRFDFLAMRVYGPENRLAAVLIFAIRDTHLKLPYAYFSEADSELVLKVILHHMLQMRLDMLTVYHPVLTQAIRQYSTPFYLTRPFSRHYLISTRFEAGLRTHARTLQDGDGDCAFT